MLKRLIALFLMFFLSGNITSIADVSEDYSVNKCKHNWKKCKWPRVVVMFLFFAMTPSGEILAGDKTLQFAWDQVIEVDLAGWHIYYSEVPGGPYQLLVDVDYDGSPGPSFSSPPVVFTSPDGQAITYYFVATAYDNSGNESLFSNEVSLTIDFDGPEAPTVFKVIIVVAP